MFTSDLKLAKSLSELHECLLSYQVAVAANGPEFPSPRLMLG